MQASASSSTSLGAPPQEEVEDLEIQQYKQAIAEAHNDWNQIMLISIAENKDPVRVRYELMRKYLGMPVVQVKQPSEQQTSEQK